VECDTVSVACSSQCVEGLLCLHLMVKQSKKNSVFVLLCPEDKGAVIIQTYGNNVQNDTASHFREF
jgi:hypothetical protein